jgi:hypothetical protein
MRTRNRILVAGGLICVILAIATHMVRHSPSRATIILRNELRQIDDYTISCWDPDRSAHFRDNRLASVFESLVVDVVVSTSAEDMGCANRLIVTSTATNSEYTFCPVGYLIVYHGDNSGGIYKLRGAAAYSQLLELVPWDDVKRDFDLNRTNRE